MVPKFERAQRVRDVLDAVRLAVGEIIHRVDAPIVAGAVVRGVLDAVHQRVAEVHIGAAHVALGAQYPRSVGKLAVLHPLEQVEVFFHAAIAVGAFGARLGGDALLRRDLFGGAVVHVGQALFDQLHGKFVELRKVIRGEVLLVPLVAQPADVIFDAIHKFGVLRGRVRIVEAQIRFAVVLLRQFEVDRDRLAVPDVQIAIRLGREARMHTAVVLAGGHVFFDDLFDEVE